MRFKSAISILLSLVLIFSLTACAKAATKSNSDSKVAAPKSNSDSKVAAPKGNSDSKVMDIGEYRIEYLGSQIVGDEIVKDVIAVNLKYTNNSKEAISFHWAVYDKLIQNNTELEFTPVFLNENSADTWTEDCTMEVQPGESLELYITYKLIDLKTKVIAEFSDFNEEHVETIEIDPSTLQRVS